MCAREVIIHNNSSKKGCIIIESSTNNTELFTVPQELDGQRADLALATILGISRTKAVQLLDNNSVLAAGKTVDKSTRLESGLILEVSLREEPDPIRLEPQDVPDLKVVHQDRDIVVVNKPPKVAAHAGPGWNGPTVVGGLLGLGFKLPPLGPALRPGIVHRLDAGTSGVMVVALSPRAFGSLKHDFRCRLVRKNYAAVVQGYPDPPQGTIVAPIAQAEGKDWRFTVDDSGKPSVTHYDTVEKLSGATLLNIHLETGRTHQIRVHFSALHHPCVGDILYGANPHEAQRLNLTRQWLHAKSIGFVHPATKQEVSYEADYPDDLAESLAVLRS